jgi:hypothetical protein
MKAFLKLPLLLALFASALQAFPPAPYYTIYGFVRDQVGQTITAEGAEILLLKGGVEVGRTPLNPDLLDQNYELKIRIDQSRSGTTFYSAKAIPANGLFSLAVAMNGALFYPIEASGNLSAGKGGERVRVDLNLGEDRDHDGLPDVWEEWQLYQAGRYPDANGVWAIGLLDRNGDFDGDGVSNWNEYVAGTFAGDATETFGLTIRERLPASTRLEFYQITGKVYTIESSLDLKTWAPVPFAVNAPTVFGNAYRAPAVGIISAFTVPRSASREFFRLTVR